jgi:hypothetical protein
MWKKLFTQNTGDYFMLNTVGRFIYTKYWALLLVEHCENIYLHKILGNTLCLNKSSHSVQHKVIPSILCKKNFPQGST